MGRLSSVSGIVLIQRSSINLSKGFNVMLCPKEAKKLTLMVFYRWASPGLFYFILVFSIIQLVDKIPPMTGFEPRIFAQTSHGVRLVPRSNYTELHPALASFVAHSRSRY